MPIFDDGDIVKGVGWVVIYFAHLEDDLDEILELSRDMLDGWDPKLSRRPFRNKAKFLLGGFRKAFKKYSNARYADEDASRCERVLIECDRIADRRNDMLHRPIFGDQYGGTLQKQRSGDKEPITSQEAYALANEIDRLGAGVMQLEFVLNRLREEKQRQTAK